MSVCRRLKLVCTRIHVRKELLLLLLVMSVYVLFRDPQSTVAGVQPAAAARSSATANSAIDPGLQSASVIDPGSKSPMIIDPNFQSSLVIGPDTQPASANDSGSPSSVSIVPASGNYRGSISSLDIRPATISVISPNSLSPSVIPPAHITAASSDHIPGSDHSPAILHSIGPIPPSPSNDVEPDSNISPGSGSIVSDPVYVSNHSDDITGAVNLDNNSQQELNFNHLKNADYAYDNSVLIQPDVGEGAGKFFPRAGSPKDIASRPRSKVINSKQETHLKRILYWNSYYDKEDFEFGYGQQPFLDAQCQVKSCYTTRNRSLVPVEQFDAIMFHTQDFYYGDIPPVRNLFQRYVFFVMESPLHVPLSMHYLKNFFNWTMTYRLDSDIYRPYGFVDPIDPHRGISQQSWKRKKSNVTQVTNYAKGKTKLIAWFVTNCNTKSKREEYVKELMKYVPVSIYGACGFLTCPRESEAKCSKLLETKYKFYLSFENSICKDYVTEKFFKILKLNVVPVVFGGANYTLVAPDHSYINVNDFESARELAQYLLYLDKHDEAYSEYFWWKKYYRLRMAPKWDLARSMCKLCENLHSELPYKSYDIKQWWRKGSECKTYGIDLAGILNNFLQVPQAAKHAVRFLKTML